MKKTFLILICALYCFRATPQTGALYCNYGENKDHLIVCLYLFQDKSFKLKISDMCVEDLLQKNHIVNRYRAQISQFFILSLQP